MSEQSEQPQRISPYVIAMGLALLAVTCLVLKPLAMRAATGMPGLGPWAKKAILREAGFEWLYRDGHLLEEPVKLERDGFELTVLGYLADPLQTSLVYALEGPGSAEGLDSFVGKAGVSFTGAGGVSGLWRSYPLATPLGVLFVQQGDPISGETKINVEMCGESGPPAVAQMAVVPATAVTVSADRIIEQTQSSNGCSVTLHRLLRTPAIMTVELISDKPISAYGSNPTLKAANGSVAGIVQNGCYSAPQADGTYLSRFAFDYVGAAILGELVFSQMLVSVPVDGPVFDPQLGQSAGSIHAAGFTSDVQVLEQAGGLTLHVQAGYEINMSPIADWYYYTADGQLIPEADVGQRFSINPELGPGEEVEQFYRRDDGPPITRVQAKAMRVPYGPYTFDLR